MKLAFIGCGNMGEAILAGNIKKNKCLVCEPRPERLTFLQKKYGITPGSLKEVASVAEAVILAVKPQDFDSVLAELCGLDLTRKIIVSVAAGITTACIERALGAGVRVVRVMPNLPAMIGEGVSGLCRGRSATAADLARVQQIFDQVGATVCVTEDMMDAVTAVSGSGPAYVFLVAECLLKAATDLGFNAADARELVYKTLSGSVHMLAASDESARDLRLKVTSKGGTTQAATDVFMKHDIEGVFGAALQAARDRAKELSA